MALQLRFLEGEVEYEVDDWFINQLRDMPAEIGIDIAKQIDWNADFLPTQSGWSQIFAGVVTKTNPPVYFTVEFVKQPEENTIYLDLEFIDSDEYLDYYNLNKTLQSNGNSNTHKEDKADHRRT